MVGIVFVLLLLVPLAELWVIVQVAQGIGVLNAIGLLLLVSVAGAWLLKQQGMATWRRLQATLQRGEMPTGEVTDGAMILLGGALLLTPGFITDVVGLVLLVPVTRTALKGGMRKLLARWAQRRSRERGVYSATVLRVERDEGNGPTRPSEGPPSPPRSDGDGSRDRG
ncbi:MAG: FxsA family protein [Actinomycetota bacterium]